MSGLGFTETVGALIFGRLSDRIGTLAILLTGGIIQATSEPPALVALPCFYHFLISIDWSILSRLPCGPKTGLHFVSWLVLGMLYPNDQFLRACLALVAGAALGLADCAFQTMM